MTTSPDLALAEVHALVAGALQAARAAPRSATTSGELHAARSRGFVRALAGTLRARYGADEEIVALCKYDDRDRERIGMNELLYDVAVCRIAPVRSAAHGKTLWYVEEPLWQVESELARDSRQALVDFNKLVLGAARHKLFVGPQVHDAAAFIDVLRPAAARCTGQVFAALIPHPDRWDTADSEVLVWQLRAA